MATSAKPTRDSPGCLTDTSSRTTRNWAQPLTGSTFHAKSIPKEANIQPSRYLRTGGKSVHDPCATSAAMPIDSPSVGCG